MKSPLNYQVSNNDNLKASLEDCLMFLFERQEMPHEILKGLYYYAAECYNTKFEDSNAEVNNVYAEEFVKYCSSVLKVKDLNLKCSHLRGDAVTLSVIFQCLKNHGSACVKVWKGNKFHYVAVTALDVDYIYLFDPYFEYTNFYKGNENVKVVLDMPFNYNRKIKIEHFVRSKQEDYCMGSVENRETIIFIKEVVSRQREFI